MKGMTPIVQNVTRLIIGFVILFSVYVTVTGHLTPGGGFAGGVLFMVGIVLIVLAFGRSATDELASEHVCHIMEGLGAFAFLAIALLGFGVVGAVFFTNFLPPGKVHDLFSGGTILLSNIAIGAKVAAGLTGIFLALVLSARKAMYREF